MGVSQILAGLLLLYNRTALLGSLLLLPIAVNVLVVDLTYLKMPSFYWRLSSYIGLIFLIFWHYRARMYAVWQTLTRGLTTRFNCPWWAYLLLPLAAIGVDILWVLPQFSYSLFLQPGETWRSISRLLRVLVEHVNS